MQAINKSETGSTIAGMLEWWEANPFAWPGGYTIVAVTDDGGVLCHKCGMSERETIAESYPGDGWHIDTLAHTDPDDDAGEWNDYSPTCCDHCGEPVTGLAMEDQDRPA